ncbi:hypothetical protein QR680_000543 [Steinernema hermaphroditum]|uniref:SCP domain-containing protein n=1 Tax=Steinernema hermaphroditum TaxID=289476 RepID=A0AA39GUZ1_9BILA|nr:hypothetical protein QR680_000543 [Steinernema hermaphroditum]
MTATNLVKFSVHHRVNNKWTVRRMLGCGSFGVVYKVCDDEDYLYALKTEKYTPKNALKVEVKVLQTGEKQKLKYFLKLLDCGTCKSPEGDQVLYIVMDLAGSSVDAQRRLRIAFISTVLSQNCPTTGLNPATRKAIVDRHNQLRSSNALGKEIDGSTGGFAPKAKNMYKMSYDCQLEKIAQSWADRCEFKHSPSSLRNAGENLYMSWPTVQNDGPALAASDSWWSELKEIGVEQFSPQFNFTEFLFSKGVGHYTQMAWAKTTKIGCGHAKCPNMNLVVCNYRQTWVFTKRVSTVDYKDCAYQTIKLKALGFRYNQRTKECISFQVVHGQFGVGPEDGEKHYYISRSDDDMCPRDVVQDMLDDRKNNTTLLK